MILIERIIRELKETIDANKEDTSTTSKGVVFGLEQALDIVKKITEKAITRVKVSKSSLKKAFKESKFKYKLDEDFYYVRDGNIIEKENGTSIAAWDFLIGKFHKIETLKIEKTIDIAKDFNVALAGRYRDFGEFSAQRFREEFLVPAFESNVFNKINIILDGLDGIGASFWDEAFGGLITEEGVSLEEINRKLVFICKDDITLIPLIMSFLEKKNEQI